MKPEDSFDMDVDIAGTDCDGTAKGSVVRYPESGIHVLIVGAGIGGMMSALECWRKGHSVSILERSSEPIFTGDNLTIQPSAMSVFRHWPQLCREIEKEQYDCWMSYNKHNGDHVYGPSPPSFNDPENVIGRKGPHVGFMQSRVKFYKSLLSQSKRLGILIEYGKRVVEYYEDVERSIGGVVLYGGEIREADIVIAADGIKTSSHSLVSGEDIEPVESGMAIYRSAFPTKYAMADETVRERWNYSECDRPVWEFWLGAGLHVLIAITEDIVVLGLTHKDNGSATESWDPDVDPEEMIRVMENEAPGWHPSISRILRTAPKGTIVHWKLMWRDLCEGWTSPAGHVVQVGDSAHSFLPSSGNGASQAIEDAITLASCLQQGGKVDASTSTQVYNKLRYQRVSCAQKMSFVNSQIKHHTDWEAVAKDPKLIRTRFPRWIFQHDPEEYAYQNFSRAFKHISNGDESEFQNTNFPKGHRFKKWTIAEVKEEIKQGKSIEAYLDGDWS